MDAELNEMNVELNNMNVGWLLESKLRQAEKDGNIGQVVETLSLQDKNQALLIAAKSRLYEVVIHLVDHGIGVHYVDSRQNNMLHVLLHNCKKYDYTNNYYLRVQCVFKLVDVGVDINQLNEDKDTPLLIAAKKGLYEVVIYMLEHGIDVHYVDSRQNNLLYTLIYNYRCGSGNLLQCVVKLVDAGVDVNQLNEDKDTPLLIAAKKGLYEVVIYLLEHGFDLHYVDSRQNNLMHILLYSYASDDNVGRRNLLLKCVVKLVGAGVDVNHLNDDKMTPLLIAARNGMCEVLMYLLEHGVDIHYVNSHQENAIHLLVYGYYGFNKSDTLDLLLQCVSKLVDAGVDVNQLNKNKETPTIIAADSELYEVVIYLLEHGADVRCVNVLQNNLLHMLLNKYRYNRYDNTGRHALLLPCVLKSVDAGVDVNQLNEHKDTPISIAAREGLYEVVMRMLKHGVDVGYVDSCQNNLMYILLDKYRNQCNHNNTGRSDLLLQCVFKLIDAGVDVNQLNRYKDTPLLLAARKGLFEVVMYLSKHDINNHCVDRCQNNLIHILLDSYDRDDNTSIPDLLQCIVSLVDAGVDVNQGNELKPIFIAASKGLYEIVMYMLDHGVDVNCVDSHRNNLLNILLQYYNSYINNDIRDLIPQCVYKIVNDNVDYVNNRQNIPLYICLDNFNRDDNEGRRDLLLQCVAKLADAGVEANQANKDKVTPIFIAARSGLYEIAMYMLEHGVDVHYVDQYKWNILHYVVGCINPFSIVYAFCYDKFEEKYIQLANNVINTGLDTNQPDYKGKTPLFHVGIYKDCKYTHPSNANKAYSILLTLKTGQDIYVRLKCKLINMLLKAGCNVNHQNTDRQTALMYHIICQSDISIIKLLISHSNLSLTDHTGDTALSYCVKYHLINSKAVFKLLVDSGSDLMSRNNGVKLFHDILKCKRLEVFSYYIRQKLITHGVTAEGENMLHLLAK
ncbi:poly [ADP-ribose] polymerase tankyrase-1 [Patella vulgata]|uniref:poly [ADP-ribose] polymerase tankyrase-1 n=1 Tax=Patella vulgata TaxID=6465 RepID=UPI0024A9464B|nr:poly [ADP-ribose] polymerase tankyrase-1 [Patella vulgata]